MCPPEVEKEKEPAGVGRGDRPPDLGGEVSGAQTNWGDSLEQPTGRPGFSMPQRRHFSGER